MFTLKCDKKDFFGKKKYKGTIKRNQYAPRLLENTSKLLACEFSKRLPFIFIQLCFV